MYPEKRGEEGLGNAGLEPALTLESLLPAILHFSYSLIVHSKQIS